MEPVELARCRCTRRSGQPLDHIASDQLAKRGIEPGDRVYVVGNHGGQLLLIGRITAREELLDQAAAEQRLGRKLIEKNWHLLGTGTSKRFDRVVREPTARALRSKDGHRLLHLDEREYRLSNRALQSVREIAPESAWLLDSELEAEAGDRLVAEALRHRLSMPERKAVEERAMDAAKHELQQMGWTVIVRTAERAAWDYEVRSGPHCARVEVKGSTGPISSIDLTRNEVESAQTHSHSILVLVSDIELVESEPRAFGGRARVFDRWTPSHEDLRVERYSYRLADPS